MNFTCLQQHIESRDVIDVKINHGFLQSDWTSAVPRLAERLRVNVLLLHFSSYIRFFVKVLIETNVNISNELNFSDTQCSLHFDKPQINEIHSLEVFVETEIELFVATEILFLDGNGIERMLAVMNI